MYLLNFNIYPARVSNSENALSHKGDLRAVANVPSGKGAPDTKKIKPSPSGPRPAWPAFLGPTGPDLV